MALSVPTACLPEANRARIDIDGMSMRYGGLQALDDVSLALSGGQVTAIIGPNGAGKSTFVNCLSGVVTMTAGKLEIDGTPAPQPILPQLMHLGIARTFQNIRLFANLTVREHVEMAHLGYLRSSRADAHERTGRAAFVDLLLARVHLDGKAALKPSELSYGERRRLEIIRGLATRPRLLLLDEPAAGMMQTEQMELADFVLEIAATGIAVILIEHHMDLVAKVANEVVVLNFGRCIARGTIDEMRADPEVIAAYLGTSGKVGVH